jgi:hypothetical protein
VAVTVGVGSNKLHQRAAKLALAVALRAAQGAGGGDLHEEGALLGGLLTHASHVLKVADSASSWHWRTMTRTMTRTGPA